MNNSIGSIGQIAEAVLADVRESKLIKLAQQQFVKEAAEHPEPRTEVAKSLHKLAEELRTEKDDVSVDEVLSFLSEVRNAG